MKKKTCVFILLYIAVAFSSLFLTGCSNISSTASPDQVKGIERLGEIPVEFQNIIKDNEFYDITAFEDRLLKWDVISFDLDNHTKVYKVSMLDLYGKELAVCELSADDAYYVTTLTATEDGGFLFVLGFSDYVYDEDVWAGDKSVASRVVKCDKSGNLQFDTFFNDVVGTGLEYCFEKDGKYYLFGTNETPETTMQGVHSPTDVYMAIVDNNGEILKTQCIAGSDYDELYSIDVSDNGFLMSVHSQSNDGDFSYSESDGYIVGWIIEVNDNLDIIKKKKGQARDTFDYRVGEKDGVTIYKSDEIFDSFDAGEPTSFIDYGDFYMIVSERITGVYENTPDVISAIWHYTETVYSAYNNKGRLLFRGAIDSSPDYDSMVQEIYKGEENEAFE